MIRLSLFKRQGLALWLVVCVLLGTLRFDCEAAEIPELDAEVNEYNVMVLLNTDDKDGARLANYGLKHDSDWLSYYDSDDRLIDALDTVVHEEFHDYSVVGADDERMYIGNNRSIVVPYTTIYRSKEMAGSVPVRCRTSRFSTYISKPIPNLASDVQGVYGLLNEFSAYRWGMNNNVKMFQYYDTLPDTMTTWGRFIADGVSNRLAYAEFKYYILHYLYYAKSHHPSVYRKVMRNEKFRRAYRRAEEDFAKLIWEFEDDLKQVQQRLQAQGYNVTFTEESFVVTNSLGAGSGLSLLNDEYSVLNHEMELDQYQAIQKALKR